VRGVATKAADGLRRADRAALAAITSVLVEARETGSVESPFAVIAASLAEFGVAVPAAPRRAETLVKRGREDWLRRLRTAGRSESALRAYRNAIDDLIAWGERCDRLDDLFEEQTIVDHLDDYRKLKAPAAATYHRRFVLLRRFMRWMSQREGLRDPFVNLEAPRKPQQQSAWLTHTEFRRMLDAAGRPQRRLSGIVERDRLVLLALVTTGLRRSELLNLDWSDLTLDEPPSLLIRKGKGDKPRRQPLAPQLADELRELKLRVHPDETDPVFCGLGGGRLHPRVLATIIRRSAERAGLQKHVTAHTLRHTAATWLRQQTGDARLVAEYLGHADLSTVTRYTHVPERELQEATAALGRLASTEVAHVAATQDKKLMSQAAPPTP